MLWGCRQLFSVPVPIVIAHVSLALPGSGRWGPAECAHSSAGELCGHMCPGAACRGHGMAQPKG